jgi:hypothetical protein
MHRSLVVAALAVFAALLGAAPAYATSVTGLSVDNSSPTQAEGAQTVYKVTFKATARVTAPGSITLVFPAGTGFAGYNGSTVVDTTTGTTVGNCGGANGSTVACGLSTGQSIAAGDLVAVTLNGVANTATAGAPRTLSVTTTGDTDAASAPVTTVPANGVSGVTVDNASPTAAAGGQTVYKIGFKTSATGALARAANSAITLTFPSGTTFAGYNGSSIDVAGTSVGNCGGANGLIITCGLFSGQSIAASTPVSITLDGITNPGAGNPSVSVSTTSDPAVIPSGPFTVAPANPLTGVSVDNSSPTTAGGGQTIYTVRFTVSATGALARSANSAITLSFPAGTTFGGYNGSSLVDTTAGSAAIGNCGGASGLTVSCGLFNGQSVPAGHHVAITLNGVTNPGAGSPSVTVSTTSDPAAVASAPFTVEAANPLTGVAVSVGSTAPGATTPYAVSFTASATGALSRAANSAITLAFPAGTTFASQGNSSVVDATAGPGAIGSCGGAVAATRTISCGLFNGQSIPAGHRIVVNIDGITNPPGAGPYSLGVSTTSDPQTVASPAYSTGPAAAAITGGPSGVTTDAAPAFSFGSSDGSVTFECRLDGPGGTGTFAPCVSPKAYSGLPPGQYTFLVRSVDAAGDPSPTAASRSFTVSSPQQVTPTPTPTPPPPPPPTPAPTATPTPTPVPGKTVVAQAVKGTVRIKRPGTNTFVELDGTQGIPVGATVDTRRGTVQLTSVQKPGGKAGTATFFAGLFKLTQTKATTDLTLNEPLAPCGRRGRAAVAAKKPKTRKLWGSGHGSFRTRGVYSAATVRGTKWLVQDSCAGTLTRVAQGVVSVRDNVRHKTITLRAGKHYLARPRR